MAGSTLFVGIGSDHGDDRIGWSVADELQRANSFVESSGQIVVRRAKSPLDLLDWLAGIDHLAICDGCRGLGIPGSWQRWNWPDVPVAFTYNSSSHGLRLSHALQLASSLNVLPPKVSVWGIEIADDRPGHGLKEAVAAAIKPVVDDVKSLLGSQSCTKQLW